MTPAVKQMADFCTSAYNISSEGTNSKYQKEEIKYFRYFDYI
jgi:hypothetical protein